MTNPVVKVRPQRKDFSRRYHFYTRLLGTPLAALFFEKRDCEKRDHGVVLFGAPKIITIVEKFVSDVICTYVQY